MTRISPGSEYATGATSYTSYTTKSIVTPILHLRNRAPGSHSILCN
jgi:hypothetical protein